MEYHPIYRRRSIRKFQDKEIPLDCIKAILKAGIAAPSAKNRQPWRCVVLGNQSKKAFLDAMEKGITREENDFAMLPKSRHGLADAKHTLQIMMQAPVLIVVLNPNGSSPFITIDADARWTEICDTLSIGAFIENMCLQAENMGIGTLWIANTCFAYQELTAFLQTDAQLIGAIALGYANEQPNARSRKPLECIAEFRL